jgi:tRNA pseudouridine synthase 10
MTGPVPRETCEREILERVLEKARAYEFRTFVIGFERPEEYDRARHEEAYRSLKVALGSELARRFPGTRPDFLRPELRIEVGDGLDPALRPSPIFIGGRYRKHSREIPASRWTHHPCRGRGCPSCSHKGTLCGPSIEEIIAAPVLDLSRGERTLFHALGREDTDARMLGDGRPFVVEVHNPRRRTLPLDEILRRFEERACGLAEVHSLAPTDREAARALKCAAAEKTYRAWIDAAGPMAPEASTAIARLAGRTVEQLSPARVMHRRGRGTRRARRIIESSWLGEVDGRLVWEARVESGTYVKELVSGDGGRTRPSIAEVLGVPCTCAALDVLEIHWTPPWEEGAAMTTCPHGPSDS